MYKNLFSKENRPDAIEVALIIGITSLIMVFIIFL